MIFRTCQHLAYCTNIHPAETWAETFSVLQNEVLAVRDALGARPPVSSKFDASQPFAIGLRLSAQAAQELLIGDHLEVFRRWLQQTNCYVFTINGFPYGGFHGTRVKEKVFLPDWTSQDRVDYTKNLFLILAKICQPGQSASVSTVPGSHKSFAANPSELISNLLDFADWLETLSTQTGIDFHLGLEPEPLGFIENTEESIAFWQLLHAKASDPTILSRRIGLNYDTCHFALEFDAPAESLQRLTDAGIRLSKIHLSNAISLNPRSPEALTAIQSYAENTYFHQVLIQFEDGHIERFIDLPEFFQASPDLSMAREMRVHFHIPLDAEPGWPLSSTRDHVTAVLQWTERHPSRCEQFEIETYTWAVLPDALKRPMVEQLANEYHWVFQQLIPPA